MKWAPASCGDTYRVHSISNSIHTGHSGVISEGVEVTKYPESVNLQIYLGHCTSFSSFSCLQKTLISLNVDFLN